MTSLYLLNKLQEVTKIVPADSILEIWQNDGINKLDTLSGVIHLTPLLKDHFEKASYFAVSDDDDDYTFHMYKAISVKMNNSTIAIYGLQIGFDELQAMGFIKDYRPTNGTFNTVAATLLSGTGWELGFVDSRLPSVTDTFYYLSRLDSISKLIEITGCEIDFKVSITANRISMKYIDFYYKMGEDKGKRFAYGTNALEIVKEQDVAELYTAIVGRGKGEEVGQGYGRRLTFANVEWKKSNGDPVDKPLGQEYVEIPEATALYGYPNGSPRILIQEYPDVVDAKILLRTAYNALLPMSRPKVQFKSTVAKTGDLKKGDTVTIVRHDIGIKYQTRVFEIKRNRKNNDLTEISLGDIILKSPAKKNADFTKNINKQIEEVNNKIVNVEIIAADGTKITHGPNQPLTAKVNDLWYEQLPNGKVNIRRWNGEEWEIIMYDAYGEEIRNLVNGAIGQADLDRLKAEQDVANALIANKNYTDAEIIKFDAKFYAETGAIRDEVETGYNNAITDGKAYTDTKSAEFDTKLGLVNTELSNTVIKANAAVTKADEAITAVGFMQPDVDAAKADASNALTAANTAKNNSVTALANAATSLEKATSALSKADNAVILTGALTTQYNELTQTVSLKADKSVVDGINGTVGTHTTQIAANAQGLTFKADASLVNTINGTVNSHTTQIKATSDGLLLKADKSLVDTLNSTVENHSTEIEANAAGLLLKASSSLVNTINGTVNTHTSQISANSTAIGLRLTSAQVESAITAKNYVNQTTLNATSTSLTASITQVSNDLVALERSSINLVINSEIQDGVYLLESTSYGANAGNTAIAATHQTSGFMPVTSNSNYAISAKKIFQMRVVYYNSSKQYISGILYAGEAQSPERIIVTPNNTAFVRISVDASNGSKLNEYRFERATATLDKVTSLELNISGIQATVANKAEQSQVTQLAGQITTKVESATYNSKMTQLDTAINLRVVQGDVTAAILADKTVKDTRNDNQLPSWYNTNYPKQTVNEFKYSSTMAIPGFTANYGTLETKVIWNSTAGGVITQVFSSADGVFQRTSNASYTAWLAWDKVAETGKLISQINVSTEGILLQGKRIQLDGDVTMTAAFVTELNTKTLTAITANIATIRSQVLIADVITSTHLKVDNAMMDKLTATTAVVNYLFTKTAFVNNLNAKTLTAITANIATIRSQVLITNSVTAAHVIGDTAMIDNLFATTALIDRLTAKAAFIASIKAIDISATKITTGTLDALKVTITNLNVSALTGNISQFVQTNWNTAVGGGVSIDGNGIKTIAGDGSETYIQNGVFGSRNPAKASLGHIGYRFTDNRPFFNIKNSLGTNFSITAAVGTSANETVMFEIFPSSSEVYVRTAQFRHIGNYARFSGEVVIDGAINALTSTMTAQQYRFRYGSWMYDNSSNSQLIIVGGGGLRFYTNGASGTSNSALWIDNYYMYLTRNLSMEGYNITNQSDRRLKNVLGTTPKNSLEIVKSWNFVEYSWLNQDKPAGIHLGLIAQDTPDLIVYDEKRDIYSIDSSKQMMIVSHATQQLNLKAEHAIILGERNEQSINALEGRVKELERKILEMESANE